MESETAIALDMTCHECGYPLYLDEERDHTIQCLHCPLEPAEGATPADAVSEWLEKHPAPLYVPTTLYDFIVPKHDGLRIEINGMPFASLSDAESFARAQDDFEALTIHCYTANQKAS